MTSQKIKFGLVGCGRISSRHIAALAAFRENAVLTCVCDLIADRAAIKAAEYIREASCRGKGSIMKPRIYLNLDDMLENEDIDVLSICTPSGLHPIHGIKAAGKHIHVLTEKPMGIDLPSADKLIKACEENEVRLFVMMQNRLNSTVRLLKRSMDKGRFGRIHMLLSNVLWQRPQSYYDQAPWRGTWEMDGGAFCNQAIHYVDMLQWLGGPVETAAALTGTLGRQIEAEDTGSAVIRYKSGAIGSLNVTMLTFPRNVEGSISVLGEKGTVKIGGMALNRIEKWEFETSDDDDLLAAESCYEPADVYGYGHTAYYSNVLDVLGGKAEPCADGPEGRKSLELVCAIYRSAREGEVVFLPDDSINHIDSSIYMTR
ncbi:MAG: Gfo/Idh/MocA family oxidoreductase [Clostridiaceae bacterium]|nr:Gfo/Idh/MocA family oxidoreductase [Clostridiaceae bacterium]